MTLHRSRHVLSVSKNCRCGSLDWNVIIQISELTNTPKMIMIWGFYRTVDEHFTATRYLIIQKSAVLNSKTFIFLPYFSSFSYFLPVLYLNYCLWLGNMTQTLVFFLIGQEVSPVQIFDHPPMYFSYESIGLKYSCVLWWLIISVIFCCFIHVYSYALNWRRLVTG
jgi:hypothetical protein